MTDRGVPRMLGGIWGCILFESKEYTDPASVDYKNNSCPVAASLRDVTVSLFLHPSWEPENIQRCIDVFKQIMSENLI